MSAFIKSPESIECILTGRFQFYFINFLKIYINKTIPDSRKYIKERAYRLCTHLMKIFCIILSKNLAQHTQKFWLEKDENVSFVTMFL